MRVPPSFARGIYGIQCLRQCRCVSRSTVIRLTEYHLHVRAWGSVRVEGRSVCLSAAAGRYPTNLCSTWAQAASEGLVTPPAVQSTFCLGALRAPELFVPQKMGDEAPYRLAGFPRPRGQLRPSKNKDL